MASLARLADGHAGDVVGEVGRRDNADGGAVLVDHRDVTDVMFDHPTRHARNRHVRGGRDDVRRHVVADGGLRLRRALGNDVDEIGRREDADGFAVVVDGDD